MVLTPAPHRHELDNTIHATFLYTTARLHPFSMQLPAVQGQSMPDAVLHRQQHGSWERTRRAPRPQPDGDAHRAICPIMRPNQLQKRILPALFHLRCPSQPTFSPWAHTSDDSYIYQLSLVLATATVSLGGPGGKIKKREISNFAHAFSRRFAESC